MRIQPVVVAVLGAASFTLAGCTGSTDDGVTAAPSGSATATVTASADSSITPKPTATTGEGDFATDAPVSAPNGGSDGQTTNVEVVISRGSASGDSFAAAGYVAGVVEEGGECTLTLTDGTVTVSASGPALMSAASTDCGSGLKIPLSSLSSGAWNMTITYSSANYLGESAAMEVQIP